jgi:hypothetical protein
MSSSLTTVPVMVRAWVDIEEGEASAEGHWYAPTANAVSFGPSDVICPFCLGPMEAVKVASIFGRIVKDEEKHYGGKTSVVVELMPPTHEAFSCSNCDMVLTSVKEEQA